MTDFDERTPTRPKMPSVTSETATNGDHDPRAETPRQPRGETQAEKLERMIREGRDFSMETAKDVALLRNNYDYLRADVDVMREDQKRLTQLHTASVAEFGKVRKDLDNIAIATGAKRTWSGEHVAVSVPPSATAKQTETGSFHVDAAIQKAFERRAEETERRLAELEEEKSKIAQEREVEAARLEGAEELRASQALSAKIAADVKDARQKRVQFWMSVAIGVGTVLGGAISELRHVHEDRPAAVQTTPH